MDRALPAPLAVRWNVVGLAALATVNFILLAVILAAFVFADIGADWALYREAGYRVFGEGLYTYTAEEYAFRYSPLMAYAFAAITPLGYWPWAVAHLAVLLALPRKVALVALVSFPFWADVYNGNIMAFVVVAAYLALSGSRWATWAFLLLTVLAPRPLMLPVLAWLLWKRPEWRWPFVGLAAVSLILAFATGWGDEWLVSLLRGGDDIGSSVDIGPSLLLGAWWMAIGIPLGVWLTYRGRLGLASLAISPYWLPYYPLVLLWELVPQDRTKNADDALDRRDRLHPGRSSKGVVVAQADESGE